MADLVAVVLSWQFLSIGLAVAALVTGCARLGSWLWRFPSLRRCLRLANAAKPWLPALTGGGLGAIPWLPRPGMLENLHDGPAAVAMVVMGLAAGGLYERCWKGVQQAIEARGIDLDDDRPPSSQKGKLRGDS
jgi:hypothetical protein